MPPRKTKPGKSPTVTDSSKNRGTSPTVKEGSGSKTKGPSRKGAKTKSPATEFPPILSDLDLHLFGEGKHHRIYEKLGAHVMTHDGIRGVTFAVWAPSADRVSVVGNFNSWDATKHPMRSLGMSGVWEL